MNKQTTKVSEIAEREANRVQGARVRTGLSRIRGLGLIWLEALSWRKVSDT